jgi:hypothetical protein
MRMMHPDGVAALLAVICATDATGEPLKGAAYSRAVDSVNSQVLRMAAQYYKVHDCDFDRGTNWKAEAMRNGLNNLAHLDRANLRGKGQ